jgi:Zn-dependent peptidase ImmA (M78 family)
MIGAAHALGSDEHLVPVTRADSALQKLERSFAQELLCPWSALNAYTDEHGMHDEALIDAAEHFQVSEWLVRSTLVNRGKLSRHRLPAQLR